MKAEGIGVLFFANDSYRCTRTTGLVEMLLRVGEKLGEEKPDERAGER
jgi:hypothetical protein